MLIWGPKGVILKLVVLVVNRSTWVGVRLFDRFGGPQTPAKKPIGLLKVPLLPKTSLFAVPSVCAGTPSKPLLPRGQTFATFQKGPFWQNGGGGTPKRHSQGVPQKRPSEWTLKLVP